MSGAIRGALSARNRRRVLRHARHSLVTAALIGGVAACSSPPGTTTTTTPDLYSSNHGSYPQHYAPPGPAYDPWGPYIAEASARFDVPERWIREVMRQESGGQQYLNGALTISNKGAIGLMQVMPSTYADLRQRYNLGNDPYQPHDNILAGAAYIREMYDRFGSPAFVAAYNAGPQRVDDHINRHRPLPAETVGYLAAVAPRLGNAKPATGPLAPYALARAEPTADDLNQKVLAGELTSRSGAVASSTPAPAPALAAAPAPVYAVAQAEASADDLNRVALAQAPSPAYTPAYTPAGAYTPAASYAPVPAAPPPARKPAARQTVVASALPAPAAPAVPPPAPAVQPQAAPTPAMQVAGITGLIRPPVTLPPPPREAEVASRSAPAVTAAPSRGPVLASVSSQLAAGGGWIVQVGAFSTPALARSAAENARGRSGVLRAAQIEVATVGKLGGGVLYRARLSGVTADAANSGCDRLQHEQVACIVLPPDRQI